MASGRCRLGYLGPDYSLRHAPTGKICSVAMLENNNLIAGAFTTPANVLTYTPPNGPGYHDNGSGRWF